MKSPQTPNQKREIIPTPPEVGLPFSAATRYGDLLFVSGMIGRNPSSGTIAVNDVQAQTAQAIENIAQVGRRAGFSLQNALKITVYLLDMELYKGMNSSYRAHFANEPPARTCVAVVALPDPEALVEIDAVLAL